MFIRIMSEKVTTIVRQSSTTYQIIFRVKSVMKNANNPSLSARILPEEDIENVIFFNYWLAK